MKFNRRMMLLLEAILKRNEGMTIAEINEMMEQDGGKAIERRALYALRQDVYKNFGLTIKMKDCGKNVYRYSIDRDELANYDKLLLVGCYVSNMLQSHFLEEFRDLGDAIQPEIIPAGNEYLRSIGTAIREHRKMKGLYVKFGQDERDAEESIYHPYCLKVDNRRWYLFAYKENSNHPDALMQCFALDRFRYLRITSDTFQPDTRINVKEYFRHSYGIWVDLEHYPVRDFYIACTPKVADYLRSLPLHHSQHELTKREKQNYCKMNNCELSIMNYALFKFHLSTTPDFYNELNRWGDGLKVLSD